MPAWPIGRVSTAALLAVGVILPGACSSGSDAAPVPSVISAKDLACDNDQTSLQAKDTIERIGGLVTDDYVVRFAESTTIGVVALVTGDTRKAYDRLHARYDVAVVARINDDGTARVTGFEQIRDLVAKTCG